uniref:Follistatin like 1 n=1 Tax=Neolamprologus brichardi TaxID=32507 RepID=A0A3Q4GW93_NEOBR
MDSHRRQMYLLCVCVCTLLCLCSVCARTFCGAGRECVSTDRGEPVCRCLQVKHWVCGSNGKSYRNHCELHRDACITQTKIHVEHRGHCLGQYPQTLQALIVCFLSDRDWMRERVIQWIQKEAEDLASNTSAGDILQTYFQVLLQSFVSYFFLFLRSLCVDALIELSDENADWKLSLTEFINCLTPTYHPTERKCALDDEVFEDGAETQMECNKCVCACGNWVCTALTCNGVDEDTDEGGEDEEMTEEEWSRRVAELNALQVDSLS